jgi:hypothetical protein
LPANIDVIHNSRCMTLSPSKTTASAAAGVEGRIVDVREWD